MAYRTFAKRNAYQDTVTATLGLGTKSRPFASALPLQAKLTVGQPIDRYEQEADQVADSVVDKIQRMETAQGEEDELQMKPLSGSLLQKQEADEQEDEEIMMKPELQRTLSSEEEDDLKLKPDIQREAMVEEEEVMMKSEHGEKATANEDIESAINQKKGGGSALPDIFRSKVEQAIGADFSGVRVHTDQEADILSRSLSARAFTTGNDIFFKQGEYNPSSTEGQRLLTHELTHTVQQNSSLVQRKSETGSLLSRIGNVGHGTIQRKKKQKPAPGGNWQTNSYKTVPDGAEIEIEFQPNAGVDAKKIGLIQMAKKVEKGLNYDTIARADYERNKAIDEGTIEGEKKYQAGAQKRKAQRSDGQSHIDRDIRMNNPVYGAPNLGKGQDISQTSVGTGKLDMSDKAQKDGTAQNYQLGYHYYSLLGLKENTKSAKLWDRPNLPGAKNALEKDPSKTSEMVFETTALCLDGKQKGMYYGSVEWGFQINDYETGPELIPFQVTSAGNPSDSMQGVMENWNEGEFEDGFQNPQIPLPQKDE